MMGFLFSALAVVMCLQMVRIQVLAKPLEEKPPLTPYEKNSKLQEVTPERGNIYDRWGHLLAGNRVVYQLEVSLDSVDDPHTIATTVLALFGNDPTFPKKYKDLGVLEKTIDHSNYVEGKVTSVYLLGYVEKDQIDQLEQIKETLAERNKTAKVKRGEVLPSLRGLIWSPVLIRTYPEKTLAANILGYYTFRNAFKDAFGIFGVEGYYQNLLAGKPVSYDPEVSDPPATPHGADIVLTIDREIQAMAERQVDDAIKSTGSASATIIIMDPKTGEILAMTSSPRMDPNEYWKLQDVFKGSETYNRAVSTTYEPGSIFKILTMAAALDAGAVSPDTVFVDHGAIEVGGLTFYNWDRAAYGPQDMTGCMQHSLNVCLAWVATELGNQRFYEYMEKFGVGRKSNVDLAEEAVFPMLTYKDTAWKSYTLGSNSFGQAISLTPLQIVSAVSAVANDGKLMLPHVLKSVVDGDRRLDFEPVVVSQPIKASTAHTLSEMLYNSLQNESAKSRVEGYSIAGKTGTAQIPTQFGYTSDLTNASFIGWGPVDDPRFIVYVWLEKPTSSIWASEAAAPIFASVVKDLVVLMDIPPDDIRLGMTGK